MMRPLRWYLAGAALARAGDEMSGPAILLLGFAVSGAPGTGSALLAGLTVAAAAGGLVFGALLDRAGRPDRMLAATLAVYALGIAAIAVMAGRLPLPAVLLVTVAAGLLNPAVAGGWTSQLPGVAGAAGLPRASALDAISYSAASLAGPALAAVTSAWLGPRTAAGLAGILVGLAAPAALALPAARPAQGAEPGQGPEAGQGPGPDRAAQGPSLPRQIADGFAAIWTRRALLRATAASAVSYIGIGMLLVCCPVLGQQRLGALLVSAMAAASLTANALLARRAGRGRPDTRVLVSTLIIGVSLAATAVAPGWFTALAVAAGGAGEGPQLTALFAVRHRESPPHMRGQIFTTAASIKIGGLALGAAAAGPLAGRSVTTCLLVAAATEILAAAAYLGARGNAGRSNARTL